MNAAEPRHEAVTSRLITPAEAAAMINPALTGRHFQQAADQLGIPYHRLGRKRLYPIGAVEQVLEGRKRYPDGVVDSEPVDQGGSQPRSKADARASAAQARQAAAKLRQRSKKRPAAGDPDPPN